MLGRVLLLSGGKISLSFAAEYLKGNKFDTVVCADSGLNAAFQLNIPVNYFMGDFDSVTPDILETYQNPCADNAAESGNNGVQGAAFAVSRAADSADRNSGGVGRAEWIQYPKEKDATDTHIVMEWIVERGAEEIVILGATGRRLDHFLANLNLLMIPLKQGIYASIVDSRNKIYLIDRDTVIYRKAVFGKYISLQPLTSEVTGITLQGFKYPLNDFTMTIGGSIGISNEMMADVTEAKIQLRNGVLVVIESKD